MAIWIAGITRAAADDAVATSLALSETLAEGVEVTLAAFPAKGEHLLLWIAPDYGLRRGHAELATALAAQGIEVWQVDINDALFLSKGSTGMRALDGTYVADLIERAHARTGKSVTLVGGFYGAIPVLRGARQWQLRRPEQPYLAGAILFSPHVYARIPPLGQEADYLRVAGATSIPLVIFQGGKAGNRWQLPSLLERLSAGGSEVFAAIMPDIVGLFYGEERSPQVQAYFETLPAGIPRVVRLLNRLETPRTAAALGEEVPQSGSGLDSELKRYRGDIKPRAVRLKDVAGTPFEVTNYLGQVTVVNFWATWCSPCVEEIPSLNRLQEAMKGTPFQLVSIDYAEQPEAVRAFMDKVDVHFPVLMDSDGAEASRWRVIAFPSTFVIGPDGEIHYGVNAAIHWDSPAVIEALRRLQEHGAAPDRVSQ